MGAGESRHGGHSGEEDDDEDEDWMQADKYAEWDCADHIDYNGTAMTVRHVEMPLDEAGKRRVTTNSGGGYGFSHEAIVFDVMCADGRVTKFTAEFTFKG